MKNLKELNATELREVNGGCNFFDNISDVILEVLKGVINKIFSNFFPTK